MDKGMLFNKERKKCKLNRDKIDLGNQDKFRDDTHVCEHLPKDQ